MSWLLLLWTVAYLYGFWLVYLLVMGLYRAHLSGRLSRGATVLGAPVVVLGYVMDVAANCTLAWLVFMEPPRELLVTSRLTRYMGSSGWRHNVAALVCAKLLDPFDPSGKHCA